MSGRFFVVDGMDGAGKSTALRAVASALQTAGYTVRLSREPGGCPLAEEIRSCMLQDREPAMPVETELLLVFAARAAHMQQTVLPALSRGEIVLCDRFVDSSHVYQGTLGGADAAWIDELARRTVPRQPDCSYILDLPVELAITRMSGRGQENRFDRAGRSLLETVRSAFRERALAQATSHRLLDASVDAQTLGEALLAAIREQL